MRDYLRTLPVFAGVMQSFDPGSAPDGPVELFDRWLRHAADEGVTEPHAMTLSTCDAAGMPDGRVLILKDLDQSGWWFSTNALSAKGMHLADNPVAALTFYWPQVGRQVRVRGPVKGGTAERSVTDFRQRSDAARAVALASRESEPLTDLETCSRAIDLAQRRLATQPDTVAPHWRTYTVAPDTVEFWNADKDRRHVRLRYERAEDRWTRTLLWP